MSKTLDKRKEDLVKECKRLKLVCEAYKKANDRKLYDVAKWQLEDKQLELGKLWTL